MNAAISLSYIVNISFTFYNNLGLTATNIDASTGISNSQITFDSDIILAKAITITTTTCS